MNTAPDRRPGPRVVLAVGALLAALALALLPLPPVTTPAAAADGGAADSAVTVTGRKGPYDDFSRLKVTVHQTKDLRSQGVRVSWTGGAPTSDNVYQYNYLQIMQCWGDDPAGPSREQCEFGSSGVGDDVIKGAFSGRRMVSADPAASQVYDPAETRYTGANAFVPFQPVGGLPATTSATDTTYFGPLDTNEQVANRTFANGTGEVNFEVQDAVEAPHLGCGANTAPSGSDPAPRACWLVVVPRGTHEADGTDVLNTGDGRTPNLATSPLSASNWAQRMVVPLSFQPVDEFCPTGQPERPTAGSELATDAVTSWQPKLCSVTGSTFAFTQGGEEVARSQVLNTTSDQPLLGFTVDPVDQRDAAAKVVEAPVAVSGVAVAFFFEGPDGVVQDMRLTPRLVAKMLTHSYVKDVSLLTTPDHLKGNPSSFVDDKEFQELNPGFPQLQGSPRSLMVPLQSSDTTRLVWNWLQSDPDARDFLSGKPDPWGTKVNPYFKDLDLAKSTELTDYPKVDPTSPVALANNSTPPLTYALTDLDPYTADLHDGAVRTLRGNNNRTVVWQPGGNGSPAKLGNDVSPPGRRAVLALVDTASAERYGLKTAALRNADGTFVKPSAGTLTAAVEAMEPSSVDATVLDPDPARAKGQAYPLTAVAYAAASTNQDAATRTAYAKFIRYVAGAGQTQGLAAGQLPFGYAPLPAEQRAQAVTAANVLERGGATGGSPSGPPGAGDSGGSGSGSGSAAGGVSGSTDGGAGTAGTAGAGGTANPSRAAAAHGSAPPSAGPQQPVADSRGGVTPAEVMGIVRWILLAVLFLGGAAGLSGPVLLRLAHRRIP
ncbi:hypothetical protein ACWC4D_15905 [Streptomyces sp. NPDC001288]|uniref:hypothetical protein n=1 Tax=Streptomyces sp. NPDC001297 TaxID=3364559 RepID=UPI003686959F